VTTGRGDQLAGVRAIGDAALLIDVRPAARHVLADAIRRVAGVADVVPGESTVLVRLRPGCDLAAVEASLRAEVDIGDGHDDVLADRVEIPVRYDGIDLDDVARATGLSRSEIVAAHLRGDYVVAFMGFVPGFAYLDGLSASLRVPRLATPRVRVDAGSVAIAGSRCCIYPNATPGGWRIVGHTREILFDPSRTPPARLASGVRVRFVEA
jgi:KipI family sensor histidine kinase inhibitor